MGDRRISIVCICTIIIFTILSSGCSENGNNNSTHEKEQLIAHYQFDEGSGNVASDNSKNGNNGEIHGAKWVEGIDGKALEFDGEDDHVLVSDSDNLDITKAITIEAWVKPKSIMNDGEAVVWKSNGIGTSPVYGLYLYLDGMAGFQIFTKDIGVFGIATNTTLELNKWSHVVGTYDGKNLITYLNGIEKLKIDMRGTGIIETNGLDLYIGYASGNFEEYFDGTIDEIKIYNYALSSNEVIINYDELAQS